ncbi:MAG: AraC family transcriptional regulator [Bacteroidales bacterium]|nr:AraC family transcriptional regulator [Bacteroidales bacterium]
MNYLVIVLASFSVLALAVVVYLAVHLYRKDAKMRVMDFMGPGADDMYPSNSSKDFTVTDQFLYDRCCRFMVERRPYLVTDYQLQDLANSLYTNRSYLSKTINRFSGKNFRAYVNYYRVMYAMELFRANMSLRIIDLALLSGFRSESSFLNNFRSVMGEAPSIWCARILKKYRYKIKK